SRSAIDQQHEHPREQAENRGECKVDRDVHPWGPVLEHAGRVKHAREVRKQRRTEQNRATDRQMADRYIIPAHGSFGSMPGMVAPGVPFVPPLPPVPFWVMLELDGLALPAFSAATTSRVA